MAGRFGHLATQPARGPADILRWKIWEPLAGRGRKPSGAFVTPSRPHDRELVASGAPQLTWIGHATFLLTLGGKRVLVDPILRERLGPIPRRAPVGIRPAELPPIDVVLVTHNHRDHLDPKSLAMLGPDPLFVAPLGHAEVLASAGARRVVELEWWQAVDAAGLEVTLVPARHWSMRFPWDRNDALWGGYVVRGPEGAAYHAGDTAYFDGFAEIARRTGAIDWAMLPIGAYEPRWFMEPQHMGPEDAVRAAQDLDARHLVAMHWGTFQLTDEPLGEPPERARAAWRARALPDEHLWILDVGETRALAR
jgi:L-ascorbate metabolism protein UlaG (beta-lactamase superfamily)